MTRWFHLAVLTGASLIFLGCPGGTGTGMMSGDEMGDMNGMPSNDNGPTDDGGDEPAGPRLFSAILTGPQEPPPVTTTGTGMGSFEMNADRTELTFDVLASGLSGPLSAAHFHDGPVGQPGGIVFDLQSFIDESSGQVSIMGVWPLLPEDAEALLNGDIYINLHTADHPNGEIRGQVLPANAQ